MRRLKLRLAGLLPHHIRVAELLLVVILSMVVSTAPVAASQRLLQRSMQISSARAGDTANYKISFTHTSADTVGSVDILFCINPIPYEQCDVPTGFDISHATLSSQTGETGYTMSVQTANHIVLSRAPTAVAGNTPVSYTFSGVKNPTFMAHSYSARLATYSTNNATGPLVDFGSVVNQITSEVTIETQVPPMLIFCMASFVSQDCTDSSDVYYTDMGTLTPDETLTASSQMAIGTNASAGFVVTVNGTSMQAGNNVIKRLETPLPSIQGVPQFGINLRANNTPNVGAEPDGDSTNAIPTANYDTPDRFMFRDGDVIASAPDVSLIRRFTMSYVVNSPKDLRPGVYTTTLTYICSGRF